MSRLKDNYESLRPLIVWLGLAELISGELASGAMGEVYRPRDLKLGRAVQHDGGASEGAWRDTRPRPLRRDSPANELAPRDPVRRSRWSPRDPFRLLDVRSACGSPPTTNHQRHGGLAVSTASRSRFPLSVKTAQSGVAAVTIRRHGCALFVAVLIVMAGCTVGHDFAPPNPPVQDSWLESGDPSLSTDPVDYGAWWAVFQDPVLDRLIELTYRDNLPLQIAALRVLEARAQLGIVRGFQLPQQQEISARAAKVGLGENAPNVAIADQEFWGYRVGFDAAWELDLWGRFRRGVEAADAGYLASIAGYDDALVTIMAEVARAYVVLRTFEERLELARANVDIQRDSLRITKIRHRNGLVPELDVTQARALLHDTEALIPTLETGARQAKHAISTLIGRPPEELADELQGKGSIPSPPADVAVGAPIDSLRRRPDVQRAELQAAAQSARIGIARSALYPRLTLLGSIGLATSVDGGPQSNDATLGDLFESGSITYTAGVSFAWPFLNYGRLRHAVRVEDVRFQQSLINYKNTVLEAAREVEDALTAFLRARIRLRHLRQSVTDAERSVELALVQYRAGLVNYQPVLDTQRFLVQQQDRLTETRGSVAINLIAAYKALGGGWQIRQGRQVLPAEVEDEMRTRTNWGGLLRPSSPEETPPKERRP